MIYAAPGSQFSADAAFTASGLVGTLGVRIIKASDGSTFLARTTAGITEVPAGSKLYFWTSTAPTAQGTYTVVWDNGSGLYASEDLIVTSTAPNIPAATLAPNALTSVGNALAWLRRARITGNASADDVTLLTLTINGLSSAIARYTGREFVDPTGSNADLARTFEYDGSGYLDWAPYDLRSITSITLGGSTLIPTTGVGDGDYALMPRNATLDGTFTYATMRSYYKLGARYTIFAPMLRTRDVVITGKWGMTSVPHDVEMACLIAVADLYRNPEQVQSRGSGDFVMSELAVNPGSDEAISEGARRLLQDFIRPKIV